MSVEVEKTKVTDPLAYRESFANFYARELSSVVGLAYVLSGSRSGAEDLAQEGFLAAYRHWEQVGALDDPGAWVRRVVANRAVSGFRRRTAELKALLKINRPTFEVLQLPSESGLVWEEVRRLPTRQAQVIALRYLDRQKIAQIAAILECSENTVKTHLARARQTLAQKVGEEFRT